MKNSIVVVAIGFVTLLLFMGACPKRNTGPAKPAPSYPEHPGQVPDYEPAPPHEPPAKACVPTGCSGEICAEQGKDVVTICLFRPEFECLPLAICERQSTGECGWTETSEYLECLSQIED